MARLQCDMESDCDRTVEMLDEKGYVYCAHHGPIRRNSFIRCRKLRPSEIRKLEHKETISY